jgi:hypothetical protein
MSQLTLTLPSFLITKYDKRKNAAFPTLTVTQSGGTVTLVVVPRAIAPVGGQEMATTGCSESTEIKLINM